MVFSSVRQKFISHNMDFLFDLRFALFLVADCSLRSRHSPLEPMRQSVLGCARFSSPPEEFHWVFS